MITLTVNGRERSVDTDPETPLLWVLRDELDLTGTKFGCGMALCGACTVLVDGAPVRSCSLPVEAASGAQITTIEGLSGKVGEAVRTAWRELEVVQCGYCQSGQIVAAVALLGRNRKPSDADIDRALAGNLCRCATYQRIRAAIHDAARRMEA